LTDVYKNMVQGVVAIMFRARIAGGSLSTSDETARVEWWTPEQIAKGMTPAYAVRLIDALRENADLLSGNTTAWTSSRTSDRSA
jgi:hypothetical protein